MKKITVNSKAMILPYPTVAAVLAAMLVSCSTLNNPFDANSPNYVGSDALRDYTGGFSTAAKPLISSVDITDNGNIISMGVECILTDCAIYNYRTSPDSGITVSEWEGLNSGMYIDLPKNSPAQANRCWFDCKCVAPDTSSWAGWTRVGLK